MIYALSGEEFEATLVDATPGLVGTIGVRVIDSPAGTVIVPRTTTGITEVAPGVYSVALMAPTSTGQYLVLWDNGASEEAVEDLFVTLNPVTPVVIAPVPAGSTNIRVMVPRVRRALEGPGAAAVMADDAIKDLTADAIAEIILYTGGVFDKKLLVAQYDQGIPSEYATDQPLSLAEQSVIATQAALNYFFFALRDLKVQETIRDEGQEWSYTLSATLLRDQMAQLRDARDLAIKQVEREHFIPAAYVSFIESRDYITSRTIEPYTYSGMPMLPQLGTGGLDVDWRFT